MRAHALITCSAVLAFACTEYDLGRPTDPEHKNPEDTAPPPPDTDDPDIRVNPTELDFGAIMKDCPSAPQEITIRNVGAELLIVDDIYIDGENAGGFEHDGAPVDLAPDETYSFEVVFTPTAWIQYGAAVEISSNDPDEAVVDVTTAGTGSEDATYEDTFQQGDGDLVATHVIVVTDEDDYSSISTSAYTSWLDNLETDPDMSALSAICGDPGTTMFNGGCTEWDGMTMYSAMAGTDYYNVALATGGHWSSICTASFAEELEYLSLVSQGMTAEFFLTHVPSSIALTSVDVNGASESYSAIDGWTWSSTTNAIIFHGDAIPAPSATIRISYPFDGECE